MFNAKCLMQNHIVSAPPNHKVKHGQIIKWNGVYMVPIGCLKP